MEIPVTFFSSILQFKVGFDTMKRSQIKGKLKKDSKRFKDQLKPSTKVSIIKEKSQRLDLTAFLLKLSNYSLLHFTTLTN